MSRLRSVLRALRVDVLRLPRDHLPMGCHLHIRSLLGLLVFLAMLLARPDLATSPPDLPTLELLAQVVFLEAEGESELGQLAVAWVVRNRVDRKAWSSTDEASDALGDVLLQPLAFSCLNPSEARRRLARLGNASRVAWERAWEAASAAWWRLEDDPTDGADHYLNEELTKKIRGGSLPSWFDPKKVTARIGRHTFLRLR